MPATQDLIRKKRSRILAIAGRHGARNLRVFGSVVRGETGPESDLALLGEMESGRGLLDHITLIQDLEGCPWVPGGCGDGDSAQGTIQKEGFRRGSAAMRDGNEQLLDILEAIDEIERYAVRGRDAFLRDEFRAVPVQNRS